MGSERPTSWVCSSPERCQSHATRPPVAVYLAERYAPVSERERSWCVVSACGLC